MGTSTTSGSPSITLVNTNIITCDGCREKDNFYNLNAPTETCDSTPCDRAPFVGACTAMSKSDENLGVTCSCTDGFKTINATAIDKLPGTIACEAMPPKNAVSIATWVKITSWKLVLSIFLAMVFSLL